MNYFDRRSLQSEAAEAERQARELFSEATRFVAKATELQQAAAARRAAIKAIEEVEKHRIIPIITYDFKNFNDKALSQEIHYPKMHGDYRNTRS